MMETIKVTFPINIPVKDVVRILEENLKQNSKFTCKVEFYGVEDNENVFIINSENGAAIFFLLGITTSSMFSNFLFT